jgi:aldose 1-epimerase
MGDVILGFSNLSDYLKSGSCHGAIVGRHANRIKNASFMLNGKEYFLPKNDGENNLHGGTPSFQNVFWKGEVLPVSKAAEYLLGSGIQNEFELDGDAVLFSYTSPDGACGFPGNLKIEVLYAWSKDLTLLILYRGESDADTLFSPTNHAYFNLNGHDSGSVSRHILWMDSDRITNKDPSNVPDGTFTDVKNTIFDFTDPAPLGPTMTDRNPQLLSSRGLDQNYCLKTSREKVSRLLCSGTLPRAAIWRFLRIFRDFRSIREIISEGHSGRAATNTWTTAAYAWKDSSIRIPSIIPVFRARLSRLMSRAVISPGTVIRGNHKAEYWYFR